MSFDRAVLGVRERFAEVLQLLNYADKEGGGIPAALAASDAVTFNVGSPASAPEKAIRGLLLVAIYGAVESSVNSVVEQAIAEVAGHAEKVVECSPAIQSIVYYHHIQSIRDCSSDRLMDNSRELFSRLRSNEVASIEVNPFTKMLQNVDGSTMEGVASALGVAYKIEPSVRGRLNNLRERRNAVAHGRESAATAGERFRYSDIRKLYEVVDEEVHRFAHTLKMHFESRLYTSRSG